MVGTREPLPGPICTDRTFSDDSEKSASPSKKSVAESVTGSYATSWSAPKLSPPIVVSPSAVSTMWGLNPKNAPPFTLKRCDMDARHSCDMRGRLCEDRVAWRISGIYYPGLR